LYRSRGRTPSSSQSHPIDEVELLCERETAGEFVASVGDCRERGELAAPGPRVDADQPDFVRHPDPLEHRRHRRRGEDGVDGEGFRPLVEPRGGSLDVAVVHLDRSIREYLEGPVRRVDGAHEEFRRRGVVLGHEIRGNRGIDLCFDGVPEAALRHPGAGVVRRADLGDREPPVEEGHETHDAEVDERLDGAARLDVGPQVGEATPCRRRVRGPQPVPRHERTERAARRAGEGRQVVVGIRFGEQPPQDARGEGRVTPPALAGDRHARRLVAHTTPTRRSC
jgi:hypothetical protein